MSDFVARDAAAEDIAVFLKAQQEKSLLRFITCGSVDDGKSTLIGRLLYDTKLIFEDQLAEIERASKKHGTVGEDIDLALLVDGLEAERQQGITIDVAYRFFATSKRKFIVADTPGHQQYTRNMATGASTADLAVILIDARRGILEQTRRHSFIASLLGIRYIVPVVNKIDLVGHSEQVFNDIVKEFKAFSQDLGFEQVDFIPISARFGDNVTGRSQHTPWYKGPTLLEHLESVEVSADTESDKHFRFPVQYISRPDLNFRGFAGTVAAGAVKPGDEVLLCRSGKTSTVKSVVTYGGDKQEAIAGEAVTLTLHDEIDASRGDCIAAPAHPPHISDQFEATVIWYDEHDMLPGRSYILRTQNDSTSAKITGLQHKINVNTFAHEAGKSVAMNEFAVCNISTQSPLVFDAYKDFRGTGAFILIDRFTNATVGAGMISRPLRRASNVQLQTIDINKSLRAEQKHQKPAVLWFTGLSASGKSTIANALEKILYTQGKHSYILDGANLRSGLNSGLGFSEEDRVENIRRVAETAKLMADAGLIVLVSFISPFVAERRMAREILEEGEFIEVFVDTPQEECERRDPKGLYRKARAGDLQDFTGIDSPYETPRNPELTLTTVHKTPEACAGEIESYLREKGFL